MPEIQDGLYPIGMMVEGMVSHSPSSKREHCRKVAGEWLRECIVTMADLLYEKDGDPEGCFRLAVDEFKAIPNRHYKDADGVSRQWAQWLSENYPLWIPVNRGFSGVGKDGRKRPREAFHSIVRPVPGLLERADEMLESMDPHAMHEFYARRVDIRLKRILGQGRTGFGVRLQRVRADTLAECAQRAPRGPLRATLKRMLVHMNPRGLIPVIERRAENGRVYHRGTNLQTAPKLVRHAVIGPALKIDAKVCSWRFIEKMLRDAEIPVPRSLSMMLQDREGFRRTLARDVCGDDGAESVARIKKALTAIPFGVGLGRRRSAGGLDAILRDSDEVGAFLRHPSIAGLRDARESLHRVVRKTFGRRRGVPAHLFHADGRPKITRALSYLYTRYEGEIRKCMVRVAEAVFGRGSVLLQVHDGIFVSPGKRRTPEAAMDKARLEFISGPNGKFKYLNPEQEFEVDYIDPKDLFGADPIPANLIPAPQANGDPFGIAGSDPREAEELEFAPA